MTRFGIRSAEWRMPVCSRCLQPHFNFDPCDPDTFAEIEQAREDGWAEYMVREQQAENATRFGAAPVVRQARRDRLTDWQGDKTPSFSERQGNSFRLARPEPKQPRMGKPRPSLTYPEA